MIGAFRAAILGLEMVLAILLALHVHLVTTASRRIHLRVFVHRLWEPVAVPFMLRRLSWT